MKNDEATQNFLQHYGVLKQKWGVRNSIRAGGPGTAYELAMMRQRKAEKRKLAREKLVPWLDSLLKGFHVFLQPRKLALAGFLLAVSWFCAMLEVYLLQLELMPGAQWW